MSEEISVEELRRMLRYEPDIGASASPRERGGGVAYLTINGRRVHLGTFESEADAAAARSAAEIAAYGDFSPSSLKTA